jgi:hypothetical protein
MGVFLGKAPDLAARGDRRDWIKMPEQGMGLVVHDVHRETESA